jgi:signal transduction histidine kinase/ActR/RegA family two-component response regulator
MQQRLVAPIEHEFRTLVSRAAVAFGLALLVGTALIVNGVLAFSAPVTQAIAIALTGWLLGGFVATAWLARTAHLRLPVWLSSLAAIAGIAYALADQGLLSGGVPPLPPVPFGVRVGGPTLLLAGGVASALLLAWVAQVALRGAIEREARFRALLSIGTDWYWELDRELKVTTVASSQGGKSFPHELVLMGRRPWEGALEASAEAWSMLQNTMLTHQPFRDFIVSRRRGPDAVLEHYAVSGEPRIVAGRFAGFWGVVRKVTIEVEARRALAAAKSQAEQASRAKTAFLANTSHEMRTPLHGVLGLARLARESRDERVRQGYLDSLLESAQALSCTISDVLDVSRIEAGRLAIQHAQFDLPALLAGLQRTFDEAARRKGVALRLSVETSLPRQVEGDSLRVRQVLDSLVGNAVKFTDRGLVQVRVETAAPDRIRFVVTDTGPGVAPELLERLFEPFTQADESDTRRVGGLGLGLWIARQLTERMGGEIHAVSTPGLGSSFRVELPLPECEAAPAMPPRYPSRRAVVAGLRVLLVEDNALNRLIASTMLRENGVIVVEVGDGEEAVAVVESGAGPFDLVLMDLQMPGITGYEATRRLRQRHDAASLPIVALTAAALDSERAQALAVGMNDFIAKPADANQLLDAVARHARAASPVRVRAGT